MKSRIKLLGVIALAVMLTACGKDDATKEAAECVFPDATDASAPGWVCDLPVEGLAVSAVGVAEKSAAGHSLSLIHISEPTRLVHSSRMPSSA